MKLRQITDVSQIKKKEIEILDYVVSVCERHGLKYILAYGTLLGAVRHKGFIPWDDDIDILMPRNDYEKLKNIWNEDKQYKLLDCIKDREYIYPFMKIVDKKTKLEEYDVEKQIDLGIYIDIFPYDGTPEDKAKRQKFLKKCECLEKLRLYSMLSIDKILHTDKKKNFVRKILWVCLKKIGPARISRKMEKTISKYSRETAEWQGCLCTRFSYREVMPKKVWGDIIELEFEGKKYKVPKEYDEMLKTNYGDYMTLPPEEERCLKHNFKVWEYVEE